MELTNKDEQYYRVDWETAKLLKDAGFDLQCGGIASRNAVRHATEYMNHNYYTAPYIQNYSAPLTAIVLVWLKELGYEFDKTADIVPIYIRQGLELLKVNTVPLLADEMETNMLVIQACCKHRIETLKIK